MPRSTAAARKSAPAEPRKSAPAQLRNRETAKPRDRKAAPASPPGKRKAAAKAAKPALVPDAQAPAQWVALDDLVPWQANPKPHEDVSHIVESIRRFGFGDPLVARAANREVIAGHGRLKAARLIGLTQVPVRFMALDAREAHLYALAANRLAEKSPWDDRMVLEVLHDYSLDEAQLAGWSSDDLEAMGSELLPSGDEVEPEGEQDEVPEPPANPVTKPGDVWILGQHVLVCGDCRDPDVVRRLVAAAGAERVHLAFTSPPYASQRKYDEAAGFKPIPPADYVPWFEAVQRNVASVLSPDGSWFVNIKEHADDGERDLYVKDLTIAHVRLWGWRFVDELIWLHQGTPAGFPNRFKNVFEPVFHYTRGDAPKFRPSHVLHPSDRMFTKARPTRERDDDDDRPTDFAGHNGDTGFARPGNAITAFHSSTDHGHTAVFPVGLPSFFVRAYSDVADTVFDPFMGSGTTLVACEQLERHAVGCELSPAYCDVIVQRWESLSGLTAQRAGG